jgi:hypothetical protein
VNVVPLKPKQPAAPAVEFGDCERAVRREFAQRDPDGAHLVELAMAAKLAQVMDNPRLMDTWPRTSRELDLLRNRIFGERKTKSRGRLSVISRMSANYRAEAK